MTRIAIALSAAAVTALGISACSSASSTTPVGSWGDSSVRTETSLEFLEDGSFSGTDGCNRVMGSWKADGDAFTIAPMATTLMACQDVDVWLVDPASVQVNGDTLIVLDADGAELGSLERS